MFGGYYSDEKLQNQIPTFRKVRNEMVEANNNATTQEARLASFEKYCGIIGVTLVDA